MRNGKTAAIAGVVAMIGWSAACGGTDTADGDTTVSFQEGVENAAMANRDVRETSNSNALATLYRVHDRTVQRAQLATERASSADVRQFAQQMLDDRARLILESTDAARTLGVDFQTPLDSVPIATPKTAIRDAHEEAMEELGGATGVAFDTTWVRAERRVAQESLDQLADFNDPTIDSTVSRLVGESRTVLQREVTRLSQLLGGS